MSNLEPWDGLWEWGDVTIIDYKVSDCLNAWIPIKWISHDNRDMERIQEIKRELEEERVKFLQLPIETQEMSCYHCFKNIFYNNIKNAITEKWNNINCFRQ